MISRARFGATRPVLAGCRDRRTGKLGVHGSPLPKRRGEHI